MVCTIVSPHFAPPKMGLEIFTRKKELKGETNSIPKHV